MFRRPTYTLTRKMDWTGMSEMEMSGSLVTREAEKTGHTDTTTTVTLTPTFIDIHSQPWHRVHWGVGSLGSLGFTGFTADNRRQQPTRQATPKQSISCDFLRCLRFLVDLISRHFLLMDRQTRLKGYYNPIA